MGNPIVLCIDDEETVLASLEISLTTHHCGYRVELVQSGEEALELARELTEEGHEIALVIADYVMPNMKGDEVLIEMHKAYPLAVKVLLTGQAHLDGVRNAINHANLYRYVTKPWEKEDLRLMVYQAIKNYRSDLQLAEQKRLIERLNEMIENPTSSPEADLEPENKESPKASQREILEERLNEEGLFEVLLFGRFFKTLSKTEKDWFARATIGLVCADKKVGANEIAFAEVIIKDDLRADVARYWLDMLKKKGLFTKSSGLTWILDIDPAHQGGNR